MKIIDPGYEILTPIDGAEILRRIETIGRVCYKSETAITEGSAERFVANVIKRGHESVIEHVSITVKFTVDRGISHEIVRHRIASYSQESTRYCNYSNEKFGRELTFIRPCFWTEGSRAYEIWKASMEAAERDYIRLTDKLECGATPEQARAILPNSLKTEIIMTANLREIRAILRLRCAKDAHPQMREIMIPLLDELHDTIPIIFDDIWEARGNA